MAKCDTTAVSIKKKVFGEIALRKVALFVLNTKHRRVLNGYVTFQVGDCKIN
jgi:hypothetical protein